MDFCKSIKKGVWDLLYNALGYGSRGGGMELGMGYIVDDWRRG